jgi:hypothetical protein
MSKKGPRYSTGSGSQQALRALMKSALRFPRVL